MSICNLFSKRLYRIYPYRSFKHIFKTSRRLGSLTSAQAISKSRLLLHKPILNISCTQKRGFGNHGLLWNIERLVYLGLAAVIPFGIANPSQEIDNVIAVLATVHLHWGMEAIAIDYVRSVIFGPVIPKLTMVGLFLLSCATLALLFDYNLNCIGITQSIRKTWEIKGK